MTTRAWVCPACDRELPTLAALVSRVSHGCVPTTTSPAEEPLQAIPPAGSGGTCFPSQPDPWSVAASMKGATSEAPAN